VLDSENNGLHSVSPFHIFNELGNIKSFLGRHSVRESDIYDLLTHI